MLKLLALFSLLFSFNIYSQVVVRPPVPGPVRIKMPELPELIGMRHSLRTESSLVNLNGRVRYLTYDVFENKAIIEGDIVLGDIDEIREGKSLKNAARSEQKYRWKSGVVFYTVNSNLDGDSRVTNAIKHWEENTDFIFVERTFQNDYVEFRAVNKGCYAAVGRQGGRQYINIESDCSTGNTIHEIGHAVGLWHTQSRSDRDNFVEVDLDNVRSGKSHNFKTYDEQDFEGQDIGSYDVRSIMHYGSFAFCKRDSSDSCVGPTITRLDGTTFSAQRSSMRNSDIRNAERLYRKELREDCIRFNRRRLDVKRVRGGKYVVTDGRSRMLQFSSYREASKTVRIMTDLNMSYQCFVGRPNASLHYFLTPRRNAPTGNTRGGEDCIRFGDDLRVTRENRRGRWTYTLVSDRGRHFYFDRKKDEAFKALATIKRHGFTKSCYHKRPNPSFRYLKK